MPAGHARDSYLVRVEESADADLPAGLYRFDRGGSPQRIDDITYLSRRRGDESFAYKHIFGMQKHADLPSENALIALGEAMMAEADHPSGDSGIPAGYTYLGQFIFHDMTFMDQTNGRPEGPVSLRTPALDLDSVLPEQKSFLSRAGHAGSGPLPIGSTSDGGLPEDLPRTPVEAVRPGCPLIKDPRNDDFLPLAQCHLALLKLYNAIALHLGRKVNDRTDNWWTSVRTLWVQHFQSVVFHDYLPRIIDYETYSDVKDNGRRVVRAGCSKDDREWLPLEFAAAVARFGHSMIRDGYESWNRLQSDDVTLDHFMEFSYRNSGDQLLRHSRKLPTQWITNWLRLFDFTGTKYHSALAPLTAAHIDTNLSARLGNLPVCLRDEICSGYLSQQPSFNLAEATLLRGRELRLASAQQAICRVNELLKSRIAVIPSEEMTRKGSAVEAAFLEFPELADATPLWFYVLREAELVGGSCKLGPLGGRIVMETVHAAIEASPDSILQDAAWRPTLPCRQHDVFTMPDLIAFAGDPNPLEPT